VFSDAHCVITIPMGCARRAAAYCARHVLGYLVVCAGASTAALRATEHVVRVEKNVARSASR